jgi:hypothetical protein
MFIIMKSSRSYENARVIDAYGGPSCECAGVQPGRVYANRESAQNDAKKLNDCNPVGFDVVTVKVDN